MRKTTIININDYNSTIIDIRLDELDVELEFMKNVKIVKAADLDAQNELDSIIADLSKRKAELLNEKAAYMAQSLKTWHNKGGNYYD